MNDRTSARDVIVVGGGVIGLSIAWELARHGVAVRVLEQGLFGQEASWAGAGMLPPGNPEQAQTIEARLRGGSHVLWPQWTEQLRAQTGIDNGFHRCGGIEVRPPETTESQDAFAFGAGDVSPPVPEIIESLNEKSRFAFGAGDVSPPVPEITDSLDKKIAVWRAEGVTAIPLSANELRERLPALNSDITDGYLLPELGQVRNPRHLKALYQACAAAGVDLRAGSPVVDFIRDSDRIAAVRTVSEEYQAAEYIVATGAWSRSLLQRAGHDFSIEPVRGQIVLLETPTVLFRQVIEVGTRYLVPRPDGRILIGSTEEHVGFEKRTTAAGVAGLIDFARRLVPALDDARVERCWAGLRPFAPGGLPRIGRVPGTTNLTLAAGHFRAGLQLSPITAVLIRQLILGQPGNEWAAELVPKMEEVQSAK